MKKKFIVIGCAAAVVAAVGVCAAISAYRYVKQNGEGIGQTASAGQLVTAAKHAERAAGEITEEVKAKE